jgi:hypothetical protein
MNGIERPNFVVRTMAAALLVTIAACGQGEEKKAAQPKEAKAKPTPTAAESPLPDDEDKKLANAVVTGKTTAPVDLQYDLSAKPALGQPFEIELTFRPRLSADVLEVEVTGIPGVTIVSGATGRFEAVRSGERHSVKVLARVDAPGLYYLGVAARMVTKVQSEARTFSVPIVVGEVAAAEKPAPATDTSGDPVESLPAVESGGPTESKP